MTCFGRQKIVLNNIFCLAEKFQVTLMPSDELSFIEALAVVEQQCQSVYKDGMAVLVDAPV